MDTSISSPTRKQEHVTRTSKQLGILPVGRLVLITCEFTICGTHSERGRLMLAFRWSNRQGDGPLLNSNNDEVCSRNGRGQASSSRDSRKKIRKAGHKSVTIESSRGVVMVDVFCKPAGNKKNFGGPCRIRTYNQRIMRTQSRKRRNWKIFAPFMPQDGRSE